MAHRTNRQRTCHICRKTFAGTKVVSGEALRPVIVEQILKSHPDWTSSSFICRSDLTAFRAASIQTLLQSEKGELSSLEEDVLHSLQEHELISENIESAFEQDWSFGQRLADRIASFGGSWSFLICFGVFLGLWILMNSIVLLWRPVDPYPFILLNLVLSCLAAIQAPVIMMSQNRQEAKDRLRSQHDYKVNLKAEVEIRNLNEKVDHLLSNQWERLIQIQEIQIEMLSEIRK